MILCYRRGKLYDSGGLADQDWEFVEWTKVLEGYMAEAETKAMEDARSGKRSSRSVPGDTGLIDRNGNPLLRKDGEIKIPEHLVDRPD